MAHNLLAMNAERMTGINSAKKAKTTEKLSSGYRINRAADDASGLAISEGMRRMIRGLNQGTANAKDGISWVKIGDGSLNEAHAILHRMTELSVKSLNGTYTDSDREMMQVEFEQLQTEIDRLTDATRFNEKHIFAEHEFPYYQHEGNKQWQQDEKHVVKDGENNLIIDYQIDDNSPVEHAEITVPPGQYSTQELVDEIDTALEKAGLKDKGLVLEFTRTGYCNMNIEGGVSIEGISGGLEYLIHDMYGGGSAGSLIGTTSFPTADSTVTIFKNVNDELIFDIVKLDGTTETLNLTGANAIPEGTYTRKDLINYLNENTILKNTSVKAVEYGNCIKLESDDSIITRLKGNMFKVDYAEKKEQVATSVFYDNIGYSEATPYAAYLKGGAVLTTDNTDIYHQYFHIDSNNNELIIQPNDSTVPKTLTIADGDYTAGQMSEVLNKLFKDNGLDSELTASEYTDPETRRKGIEITSLKEGLGSKVGIDSKSSAYKTLFTTHAYNQLEIKETYTKETKDDKTAWFQGGKDFVPLVGGNIKNLPLTVIEGKNDKFTLNINGTKRTVTLKAGRYDNTSDLTSAVKDAIDAAADRLSDAKQKEIFKSINVTLSSNCIRLTSDHEDVVSIEAEAIADNTGYSELFTTTTNYKHVTAVSEDGVDILNTPVSVPVNLKSGENTFKVTLDGHEFDVTIPVKKYDTEQDLLDAINAALPKAKTEQINKPFEVDPEYGSYNTGVYSGTSGVVASPAVNYSAIGTSNSTQGGGSSGQPLKNTPAAVTFSFSNNWPLKLDSSNNVLKITINKVEKEVTLTAKEYNSIDDLRTELQSQLNTTFTSGQSGVFGGVTVTNSGSKGLTLTANLMKNGVVQDAKLTNIECSTGTSTFLKKINTTEQKASLTIGQDLNDSFTINSNNNNFAFQYYTDGAWKAITVTIPNNTTKANLAAQLNSTAGFKNNGITASIQNNKLVLTANTAKDGDRLRFNSDDCKTTGTNKSCVEAIFKNVDKEEKPPKDLTLNEDLGEPSNTNRTIKIEAGKQKFTVSANGKTATFDIPIGTYDLTTNAGKTKLVNAINTGLKDNGMGEVSVSIDSNYRLVLKNTNTGKGAYTKMIYDGSDTSAMPAMFGTTSWTHQGIKAEFDADKNLKLTAVDKDGNTKKDSTISVNSQYGSIFQTAQPNGTSTIPKSSSTGYHSKTHASINGAPLQGSSVTIDKWNKELNFYYHNGTSSMQRVSLTLDENTYTFAELQTELQSKLDAATGQGVLKAEVTSGGVKILAGNTGSKFYFEDNNSRYYYPSGGFYYNVLRRAPERKEALKERVKDGGYDSTVYAMGRQNVRNGKVITKGVNDVLTMDFTYGTNTKTFSLTLTPGNYSGAGLVRELQSKLNEELKKAGFAENLIQVEIGVGGITLPEDLIGYNNDSLTFKLADNAELPTKDKVTYKIDGIGGNAAFSIFYQTDGDMRVAYVKGSKDVKNGVVVPKDCEFSLNVDGNPYTINVDKGDYTAKEITEYLNKEFKAQNINITAKIEDGNIKLMSTKYGKHPITNITGDARRYLFFEEKGEKDGERGIWIRLSGVDGDGVIIERPVVNTVSLGINSITISKMKYAEKALSRLKAATVEVSGIRTMFGTMENRLEHKVNSNNNAAENTQAAESLIRDADIADEIMELSINRILEQAAQAMLTQANQSKRLVLSLLQ